MTAKVYVTLKKAVLDPQGKAVERSLAQLGFPQARNVRVGRFIEIGLEAASGPEAHRSSTPCARSCWQIPSLKTTASRSRGRAQV